MDSRWDFRSTFPGFSIIVLVISAHGFEIEATSAHSRLNLLQALQLLQHRSTHAYLADNIVPYKEDSINDFDTSPTYLDGSLLVETSVPGRETSANKRGWEDVSFAWRQPLHKRGWESIRGLVSFPRKLSPKRALAMVRNLWRIPEIREKYKALLREGKRSDEQLVNVPVQSGDDNPTWMMDEIEYDQNGIPTFMLPHDDTFSGEELGAKLPANNHYESGRFKQKDRLTKRGWEFVGNFQVGKRSSNNPNVKTSKTTRGWEDMRWKRNGLRLLNGQYSLPRKINPYLTQRMLPTGDHTPLGKRELYPSATNKELLLNEVYKSRGLEPISYDIDNEKRGWEMFSWKRTLPVISRYSQSSSNVFLGEPDVFHSLRRKRSVTIDGPRNADQEKAVQMVRKYVKGNRDGLRRMFELPEWKQNQHRYDGQQTSLPLDTNTDGRVDRNRRGWEFLDTWKKNNYFNLDEHTGLVEKPETYKRGWEPIKWKRTSLDKDNGDVYGKDKLKLNDEIIAMFPHYNKDENTLAPTNDVMEKE
ncbi:hypothetical protein MAR_028172 [Mya arenaria]|uniref:Uncharacterized protein n=1 Tax=Mya arenaria TaxID=6604 RepID=A0ABY7DCT3_MYAAR|nr:uncharacterized protein LOC128225114 [Mya arenaria]WAQ95482.1 hypothetical protein MAR_028172 [Mya arenaria]